MAHEDLMERLPEGFERVAEDGIFFIRNNGGSYSVTALLEPLITISGIDSKERAGKFACSMNRTWNRAIKKDSELVAEKLNKKQ